MEPHDVWATGIDPPYQDRAPRVERNDEGSFWVCDDKRLTMASGMTMDRDNPRDKRFGRKIDSPVEGGFLTEAKLKDMDFDQVFAEVVYPTAGIFLFYVPDGDLFSACAVRLNDVMAAFCNPAPDRLRGIATINLDDIESGTREMKRCIKLGLGGVAISVYPSANPYDNPEYDKFWAVAEESQMPISLHAGTNRSPRLGRTSGQVKGFDHTNFATLSYWVMVSVGKMIFSGVFERFPGLKVVIVEHDVGWAPYWMSRMDYSYTQRYRRNQLYRFQDPSSMPSDFFRKNVFISFQEDDIGIQLRDIIGVENLMWGSDYPHTEGTFPKSQEVVANILKDVPEPDAEKIRASNAARVYNLSLPILS